jgi:hypothetical protein
MPEGNELQRDTPLLSVAKIVAFSVASTLVVTFIAFIAGFHGNFLLLWVYVMGPAGWICRYAASDDAYLWVLPLSIYVVSLVDWSFILLGPKHLSDTQRIYCVLGVHLAFAIAFHAFFDVN